MPDACPSYDDRLLAEAVRAREADGAQPLDDRAANEAAGAIDGSFEQRIVLRARELDENGNLSGAVSRARLGIVWSFAVLAVLALLAGAGAALGAFGEGAGRPVNVFWVLITLLGVQTGLLLVWALAFVATVLGIGPRLLAGGSLGALVLGVARGAGRWLRRAPAQLAGLTAVGGVTARGPIGIWTLSALSHALWTAFNVGAIALLLVLLSTRQYRFVWETTILSPDQYVPLTRALGAGPERIGFAVPTEAQVRASRLGDDGGAEDDAAEAWAGWVTGCLVVYGLLPRLLLSGTCLVARRRATRRFRLDFDHPGYARLRSVLAPSVRGLGVIDADEAEREPRNAPARIAAPIGDGPPAIVGFELAEPPAPWPPPLAGADWIDLGHAFDRDSRHDCIEKLAALPRVPGTLVIVASLVTTPDRGTRRFFEDLAGASAAGPTLLLTGGHRARERRSQGSVEGRVQDWRAVAASLAVPDERVVEIDLDHLTDATRARLGALLGLDAPPAAAGSLDEAFDVIRDAGAAVLDEKGRAELHRRIARVYANRGSGRSWFSVPQDLDAASIGSSLREGAGRIVGLLPAGMKLDARWIAAGTACGAFGCIAAATLISPVAIGALPLWSGIGAGLAALLKPAGGSAPEPAGDDGALSAQVRAAALHALLLDAQGLGEAAIGRVLEASLAVETPPLGDSATVAPWLDEVTHRYGLAVAKEAGR